MPTAQYTPAPAARHPLPAGKPTHLLFDFFGTLVDYRQDLADSGFRRCHRLVQGWGSSLDEANFRARWTECFSRLNHQAEETHQEFSMSRVGGEFLTAVLPQPAAAGQVTEFTELFLSEWTTEVHCPAGVTDLLASLARGFRLAVVTNTHHAPLVPGLLKAMGVSQLFDAVVTSVEVGWRKPHPKIFTAALETLAISADAALFVGDSYQADFRGALQAGIPALLIDPEQRAPVPDTSRLMSFLELATILAIS